MIKAKGSVGRSVLVFTLIGITAGAIAGGAEGDSPCDPNSWYPCELVTAADKALTGAFVFGFVGSVVGFAVGSLAKDRIVIGGSQFVFEKNVELLRKYSASHAPQE